MKRYYLYYFLEGDVYEHHIESNSIYDILVKLQNKDVDSFRLFLYDKYYITNTLIDIPKILYKYIRQLKLEITGDEAMLFIMNGVNYYE